MKVTVTLHAIDTYRRRRGDKRPMRVLEKEIAACVEKAVKERRLANHRPEGFVLYRRKKSARALPPGQWFAPCGEDVGFIIKKDGASWVVITTIVRVGVRR
jgi:hypothetical protein